MKKCLSLCLALVMLLSAFSLAWEATAAATAQNQEVLFDNAQVASYFWDAHNLIAQYNGGENAMQFITTGQEDPYVTMNLPAWVDAGLYEYVVITYRAPVTNSGQGGNSQLFWSFDNQFPSAARSLLFSTQQGYKYRSTVLDMSDHPEWHGMIARLRIDPFSSGLYVWDTLFISSIVFCQTQQDATEAASAQVARANGVMNDLSEDLFTIRSFNADLYMQPIWQGNIVYNESVLPVANSDGSMTPIPLAYTADRVISVRNSTFDVEYQVGRDYDVIDGKLYINPYGTIPILAYSEMHSATQQNDNWWPCLDGTYVYMAEGAFFHILQLNVTYAHSDAWSGAVPVPRTNTLCRTATKLRNQEPLNIVFYGDSITVGGNASSFVGAAPYCPIFADLTIQTLAAAYGTGSISYVNTAMGGTMSAWGAENVAANVTSYAPDLLVLGFGMNDLTCGVTAEDYLTNMRSILTSVRAANPLCEVILISPIAPNPAIFGHLTDTQTAYLGDLYTLATEFSGVAVADITTMHRTLLSQKRYEDMTGNNINHLNDFLTRLYAQTLVATLIGAEPVIGTPTTGLTSYVGCGDYIFGDTFDDVLFSGLGNTVNGTNLGVIKTNSIWLLGWLACSKKIVRFGYRYGNDIQLTGVKYTTEDAVIQAGAPIAGTTGETTRFLMQIPIRNGTQGVYAVAELEDGSIIDFWALVYAAVPAALWGCSFDSVFLDSQVLHNTGETDQWLQSHPIHFTEGAHQTLTATGWAHLSKRIQGFAYRIDGGERVDGSFVMDRPEVKEAIGPDAESFFVTADISGLTAGVHTVDVIAIATDGSEVVATTVPFSVTNASGITQQSEYAAVTTSDGLSYTAQLYSAIVDQKFRITTGFTVKPDAYIFDEPFNRMGFTYSSTKPLRMTVRYVQDGVTVADAFYLDAAEDGEFHALIKGYLSGASATKITSIRFDSCTGERADFYLQNITIQSYTVYDEDVFYFENARFKIGLQLNWGGGISYIEDKTHVEDGLTNLINHYDTGRLVQQSYYGTGANPDYTPGAYNNTAWVYNPVQGGNMYNEPSRLIDFVPGRGSVYIKVQPQDWSVGGVITPSYMENVYSLYDDYIGVVNRFTDYSGFTHPYTSQEVPAFYTVSCLDRFSCYLGSDPWTKDTLTTRNDLNFWGDAQYSADCTFTPAAGDTETWCAWTASRGGFGIGLYVSQMSFFVAGRFSYDGSNSPVSPSTNYVAPVLYKTLESFETFSYRYQITTGTVDEIRDTFYKYNAVPPDVTVSFEAEGADAVPDKTVSFGLAYGELPVPVREGYQFLGWFTEADGGTLVTAETTVATRQAHTLYAHWAKIVTTGISVLSMPAKTVYTEGETLDTAGLTLSVAKSDGSSVPVSSGFTCDPLLLDDAGTQTITVSYEEFTTTFPVTVEIPVPTETSPRLTVCADTTRPGCEVDVTVEMTNNPGLYSAMIDIEYDRNVLELVRVQDSGLMGEGTMARSISFNTVPYMVSWEDTQSHAENGTLVTFTFRVKEGADVGSTPITLRQTRDYTLNTDGKRVRFAVTNDSVRIVDRISGDVDADGRVTLLDVAAYSRYLVGGWDVTIDETSADVNADGVFDLKDVILIRRFLAGGWNVTLA